MPRKKQPPARSSYRAKSKKEENGDKKHPVLPWKEKNGNNGRRTCPSKRK